MNKLSRRTLRVVTTTMYRLTIYNNKCSMIMKFRIPIHVDRQMPVLIVLVSDQNLFFEFFVVIRVRLIYPRFERITYRLSISDRVVIV